MVTLLVFVLCSTQTFVSDVPVVSTSQECALRRASPASWPKPSAKTTSHVVRKRHSFDSRIGFHLDPMPSEFVRPLKRHGLLFHPFLVRNISAANVLLSSRPTRHQSQCICVLAESPQTNKTKTQFDVCREDRRTHASYLETKLSYLPMRSS